jgi:hypothetical protein
MMKKKLLKTLNNYFSLDKTTKLGYNIYIDRELDNTSLTDIIVQNSINVSLSNEMRDQLIEYSDSLKTLFERFPEVPLPKIMGGYLRDLIFGLKPNDLDIFIDTSSLESEEERQDLLCAIASTMKDIAPRFRYLEYLGNDYIASQGKTDNPFYVYQILSDWEVGQAFPPLPLQFIGHNNELISKDPFKFVEEYFDWELCKIFYCPVEEKIFPTSTFLKTLISKELVADSEQTLRRISNWKDKWENASKKYPFSIKENFERKSIYEVKTARSPTRLY